MNYIWEGGATAPSGAYHRCHLAKPMRVPLKDWNGSKHNAMVNQVGYVKATEHGTFHANIFGSISKQMPMSFDTLAEAKRYVEDHATTGLVIKQLHVDV
jgi:hypothetical protein